MITVIVALSVCMAFLAGLLIYWSPGRVPPFRGKDGTTLPDSIAERVPISIGGTKHRMIIKSKNIANPVLLFLHGGPGVPGYFLAEKYSAAFEENFTVCYLEYQAAGFAVDQHAVAQTITSKQLIADTLKVTGYLQTRFSQSKIYLAGHSWSSYLGVLAAAKAPELYHAYIGISQLVNQPESKSLTIDKMKSAWQGFFLPVMRCRSYTLKEKAEIWQGKASLSSLTARLQNTDLSGLVKDLSLPVYFVSGIYNDAASCRLMKESCQKIQEDVLTGSNRNCDLI